MVKDPVRIDVVVNGRADGEIAGLRPHCIVIVMLNTVPICGVVNVWFS
jgi:hypothetical protein